MYLWLKYRSNKELPYPYAINFWNIDIFKGFIDNEWFVMSIEELKELNTGLKI